MKTSPCAPTSSLVSILCCTSLALLALGPETAHAASGTWTGAADGNTWANAGNWTASPAPGSADTATFGTVGGVIDLGAGGVTVNTIDFTGGASSPANITLGAGAVNSQTLTVNNGGNGAIKGSGTRAAASTLTINAALRFSGANPQIAVAGSLTSSTPVTIAGNVTTTLASGTCTLKVNSQSVTCTGVLSDGSTAKLGVMGQNGLTITLSNPNNSFTGDMGFDNGSVSINSISDIGTNSAAGAGGVLQFGSGFGGGALIHTGSASSTTNRVINMNNGYFGPTITQSATAGLLKFTANVTNTAVGSPTFTLNGNAAGTGEIAGVIGDNGTTGSTLTKAQAAAGATSIQLHSVDGIVVGAAVSGTGIASGTTVTAISVSNKTITISPGTSGTVAQGASLTIAGVKNITHVAKSGSGTWTLSGNNTYTGNTTINDGGTLIVNGGLKFVVTNSTANKVAAGTGTGTKSVTLNCPVTIDTSAVTTPSGSWPLIDTATLNETYGASFSLVGFSGPVSNEYTKLSGVQKWTFNKSTGVLSVTSDAVITSFGIPGSAGVINQTNRTIALTVPYTPWGVSGLASLAPTFTLTSGTCNQTSGSPPSPTFASSNPVTYTVTDGATVNNYVVTVTVAPPSTACTMLTCDFGALGQAVIDQATGNVIRAVPPTQQVTALAPTFTLSTNASISPASGSTQNFTNPVVYRVTAEDGVTYKDYTVSVQSYATWTYFGSMFINTTPSGANVTGSVTDFPLLVRFNSSNFNFAQAQSDGSDIRFSMPSGTPLSYQIEQWDAAGGNAAVWVKIPSIAGSSTQEIIVHWGKSGVSSESNGPSVFNAANGFGCVMHMNGNVLDSTGLTSPVNAGATPATGVIGNSAYNLAAGTSNGAISASNINHLPSGSNPAVSGSAWIRPRDINTWSMPLAWGNKNAYGWNTWNMQVGFWGSPPQLPTPLTCRGPAATTGATSLVANQWYHVFYTTSGGTGRVYINGVLDGTASGGTIAVTNPQVMNIGAGQIDGDIDEARISTVARSADWVKLEYENQKPMQTLVGAIVSPGSDFSVSPASVTMNELATATLTAQAGGARKTYWIYKKNGQETVLATDQLTFNYSPGRITGNDSAVIQFKAVFAGGTQTIDVPLTVIDTVPDPVFTLTPSTTTWDGRATMTVTANITNLAAMQAAGYSTLNYKWTVSGLAVVKQESNGTLTLTRSQGSGPLNVSLAIDNGGSPVNQSVIIDVQEPASEPWLQRTPGATEKAVNGQFIARNPNTNMGTVFYNGTQSGTPDSVYLKVYQTPSGGSESLYATHTLTLGSGGAYAFSAPIPAGLYTYRVVYGTTVGSTDTNVATVTGLICGDAYIVQGQSNALATDIATPPAEDTVLSLATEPFVRTFSWTTNAWVDACRKGSIGGHNCTIGYWAMPMAIQLKNTHNMPICIINGAVGGTRIDQHRPNPADHGTAGSAYSIYANLYNRVVGAKLTHGIRGVFWHQGESNSGADSPTGDWDYKSYQSIFVEIANAWKVDFPNIQRYITFQVQPKPCSMGPRGDQLREAQRTLSGLFSNMSVLATIGVDASLGYAGCHYYPPGYNVIANMVAPLVGRDFYGVVPTAAVTSPNLKRAYYTNAARNQIALEFDQPTQWNSFATQHFYLDDVAANISSGSHSGNTVTLQLASVSNSTSIDYVQDQKSSTDGNAAKLITGANTIAALTFADVAIGPAPPAGLSATGGTGQVALSWTATTGATGYKIKRSTTNGGPYTTIATTSTPTFTDTSVTAGTPYYYVVSAVNTVGASSSEGLDSTQATATPIGGYAAWASLNGTGNNLSDDHDADGVKNGVEYFLGGPFGNTTGFTPLPGVVKTGGTLSVTWVKGPGYNGSYPTDFVVETSDALNGTWTPETSGVNVTFPAASEVKYTFPAPLGTKKFVRLKVTGP